MTGHTVLEILQGPGKAAEELRQSRERLEQISAACLSTTAKYGSTGGGHTSNSGTGDGLSVLADAVSRVRAAEQAMVQSEKAAQDLLDTLRRENETFMERDYMLLRMRYILRLPWITVQDALVRKGFRASTLRAVYKWHRRAIESAQHYMKEDINSEP